MIPTITCHAACGYVVEIQRNRDRSSARHVIDTCGKLRMVARLLGSYALNFTRTVITMLSLLFWASALGLFAQTGHYPGLQLNDGRQIYEAACVACHGPDGKGMPNLTVGFEKPDSFPDFSRCDQTTPELNTDWKAVIVHGGEFRGFSQIMPSFGEALTDEQIDKVIKYVRRFCTNPLWPR